MAANRVTLNDVSKAIDEAKKTIVDYIKQDISEKYGGEVGLVSCAELIVSDNDLIYRDMENVDGEGKNVMDLSLEDVMELLEDYSFSVVALDYDNDDEEDDFE